MKVYKHYRPMAVKFPLIFIAVLGAVGIIGLVWSLSRGVNSEPPPFIFLFLIVISVGNGWFFGGVAIEVRLTEDGYIEFIGPLQSENCGVRHLVYRTV